MKNLKFCDGKEVNIGDTGFAFNHTTLQFINFKVSEENISDLIKLGIIIVVEDTPKKNPVTASETLGIAIQDRSKTIPMDATFYHNLLVEKISLKGQILKASAHKALLGIQKTNYAAYFSMLLKEVALLMDESYSNHISEHPVLFAISQKSGKLIQIQKEEWKSLSVGALFRNQVDAIVALKILASVKKEAFKNGRRK